MMIHGARGAVAVPSVQVTTSLDNHEWTKPSTARSQHLLVVATSGNVYRGENFHKSLTTDRLTE
jgi:hypothetical protein